MAGKPAGGDVGHPKATAALQRDGEEGERSNIAVWTLTYHLLVLLDDRVGVRPQEDVKIQHSPDGPPGQGRSGLQGHLCAERGQNHSGMWGAALGPRSHHGARRRCYNTHPLAEERRNPALP